MQLPLGYRVRKDWDRVRNRGIFWVECGERSVGMAWSESEVLRLVEFDCASHQMENAMPASREKPNTYKGIAIE